jgi:RNA polymerase sigma-70 factor (ECF subfamily)
VLYRLTGTRHEAEDLVQEVFLRLYRRRVQHGDNVAGWLYRVATNLGYNALRAEQRRARHENLAGRAAQPPPTPEDEAESRETQRLVRAALARLKSREAKLLVLKEMGLSYHELADIIGVAPGSVGTLLARAQRAFLEAYGVEEVEGHATSN